MSLAISINVFQDTLVYYTLNSQNLLVAHKMISKWSQRKQTTFDPNVGNQSGQFHIGGGGMDTYATNSCSLFDSHETILDTNSMYI